MESIRVIRADGNLTVASVRVPISKIDSDVTPEITRNAGVAEVILNADATIAVPPGVVIEIVDLAGNLEAADLATPLMVGRVRGNFHAFNMGAIAVRKAVGGNFEVEAATDIEAGIIGGKMRISGLAGNLRVSKVGGKLVADSVTGDVNVGFVGGHVRLNRIEGNLTLEEVGGAIDLSGPLPPAKSWFMKSRGRVAVEVDPDASFELDAAARWGRVSIRGLNQDGLERTGRSHWEGTIGAVPETGERTKLDIEARGADVIIAAKGAHQEDFCGRERYRYRDRSRLGAAFAAPFEDLADELTEEVPAFVRRVLETTAKVIADGGEFSGDMMRDVARELKRGVGGGLYGVERAFSEIGETVPTEAGEKLAQLGREIAELMSEAPLASPRARRELRHRVREAAREVRDTIRDAARELRFRRQDEASGRSRPRSDSESTAGAGAEPPSREEILKILTAVKEGRLEPEEADSLIGTWMGEREAGA
ncbi:MAG TPA: hypothetical protein VMT58_09440 [Candidatus Binataceae bacterium]|nr:hypothetical protein [Candidatus Binataceae bacterium]